MFKNLSSKTKLLVPTFGLITILITFGILIIVSSYSKIISLKELNSKIITSNLISDVIHSMQRERGLSSGCVTSKNTTFKSELLRQRKRTDKDITILLRYLKDKTPDKMKKNLENLKKIRQQIDTHSIDYNDVMQKYSALNNTLLKIITKIAKSSHIPNITQNIIAYSNLLYLKENAGLQRAQGVIILSEKHTNFTYIINFISLISIQKQNELMFLNYASEKIKNYYKRVKSTKIFKQIDGIELKIKNQESLPITTTSKSWYDIMTKKLDRLDQVGKFIKRDTSYKIHTELKDAKIIFTLIVLLVILSLIIFTLLIISFLKLAADEQRLRVVMDKYIISSITDLKGKIIDVSEAFCTISGYKKSDLIGKNHNIVRHPDMPKEVFKELWSEISKGNSWSGKVKNRKKDGGFYWVYANIEPLYNKKGEIDSYISIRLDITENELLMLKVKEEENKNKQQEKMMQQQHRLAQMGEMISMIAHQWRQPLSAITAASGSLSLKAKLDKLEKETAIELAEKIKGFSLHLSSTIDDFRNFFKSNKTKNKTDFKQLVNGVLSIVESSLEKNNISIVQNIVDIKEFRTYENELKQVLLNLIKNAEDALLEKKIENPQIKIIINGNRLTISDNAKGINEDILDKIFEPYFSTKLKKDGTGLGLYMSKLIIENHCGGKLTVQNDPFGASFTIVLEEDLG